MLPAVERVDFLACGASEVQSEQEDLLVALANRAVDEDNADVVILSGAPLAGLATKVRDRISVPVIDPVAAAVRQAETLAVLKPRKAIAGTFRRPDSRMARKYTSEIHAAR